VKRCRGDWEHVQPPFGGLRRWGRVRGLPFPPFGLKVAGQAGAEPGSALPRDSTWFGGSRSWVLASPYSHVGTSLIIFLPLARKGTPAKGCKAKDQPRLCSALLQVATVYKNGLVLVCSGKETSPLLQRSPRVAAFQHRAQE